MTTNGSIETRVRFHELKICRVVAIVMRKRVPGEEEWVRRSG